MRLRTLLCMCAMACPVASLADDSPLSGYFHYTFSDDHQSAELDSLACATSFFHQTADGKGEDYILNRDVYQATGVIQYQRASSFTCTYAATTKTELCNTTVTHGAFPGGLSYFRYVSISKDTAVVDIYGDKASFDAALRTPPGDQTEQAARGTYTKCDWLSDATLKAHLQDWDGSMTDDQVITAYTDPFSQSDHVQMLAMARAIKATLSD
jgi:hypothetical protein